MSKLYEKTVITFRFKTPIAFSLPPIGDLNLGNYYPYAVTRWEHVPNINKRVPKIYYNLDYPYQVILLPEIPREDIISEFEDDPDVVKAYRVDQAKQAAQNHALNNVIRDRLKDLEKRNVIEILSDTFMDYRREKKAAKKAVKASGGAQDTPEIVSETPAPKPKAKRATASKKATE